MNPSNNQFDWLQIAKKNHVINHAEKSKKTAAVTANHRENRKGKTIFSLCDVDHKHRRFPDVKKNIDMN